MFTRLIRGMSHNGQDDEMHPLTAKSLRGVMSTYHQDSEQEQEEVSVPFPELEDWEMSYHQADTKSDASSSSTVSKSGDDAEDDEEENDCFFCLEM